MKIVFVFLFSLFAFSSTIAATTNETIYVVKSGDTLSTIAQAHNVSSKDIMEWNNKKTDVVWVGMKLKVSGTSKKEENKQPEIKEVKKVETKPTNETIYVVKSGDTLSTIAQAHNVSSKDIMEWNNKKTDVVWVGMKLKVSGTSKKEEVKQEVKKSESKPSETKPTNETIYVVKSGDTLSTIAQAHNVSSKDIMEWNNKKTDVVWVGMKLKISGVSAESKVSDTEPKKEEPVAVSGAANLAKPRTVTRPTNSKIYTEHGQGIIFQLTDDTNVYASLPGVVIAIVDSVASLKPLVIVKHGNETVLYGKLDNVIVKEGDRLTSGAKIGTYNSSGLYFAYRKNGDFINPTELLLDN